MLSEYFACKMQKQTRIGIFLNKILVHANLATLFDQKYSIITRFVF